MLTDVFELQGASDDTEWMQASNERYYALHMTLAQPDMRHNANTEEEREKRAEPRRNTETTNPEGQLSLYSDLDTS